MVTFFFQLTLWVAGGILTLLIGYLLLLTGVAWLAVPTTKLSTAGPKHRFAIFVPAHNEEKLLPALLASVNQLDYPRHLFTVAVVADNCTDRTAALARAAGASVYERLDAINIGKGYALQWLLARLREAGAAFDAAVIVDADSILSSNFLNVMDTHLTNGERVIQAHYAVLHPERAWVMHLRAVALTLVHYVRPLGRTALGGSVGLKGNGMVFRRAILEKHPWSASVTEDIEYHMALVLAGERVAFAPDATVWAEMPGTLRGAHSQNVRWEQGRLQLALHYVPQLLQAAFSVRRRPSHPSRYVLFDSIMEHIIPPFSLLMGMTLLYLLLAAVAGSTPLLILALFLLGGQFLYILGGLLLARTPAGAYLALLYAPFFVLWKVWLLLRMVSKGERQGWIRTARDGV